MGMNYYAIFPTGSTTCPTCHRPGHVVEQKWHIGKSSYGWCFSLHVGSPEEPHIPRSLDEWREAWKRAIRIENEDETEIPIERMEQIILAREGYSSSQEKNKDESWFRKNQAERGPHNLARHSMAADRHCVGHGDGTYDLITGIFC
jgi:hypothetical protein